MHPLAFEIAAQARQRASEAHLCGRFGRAAQARDLGERGPLD
jgi:hypothetical protein